ncbi:MAG: hypothetical protein KDC33_09805 [Thermoleophilia bacterium]|nr:hypothetical protein [Thermoleophilia bacterium]
MRSPRQRGQSSIEAAALFPLLLAFGGLVLWLIVAGAAWLGVGASAWGQAHRRAVDPGAGLPAARAAAAFRVLPGAAGEARVEGRRRLVTPAGGFVDLRATAAAASR